MHLTSTLRPIDYCGLLNVYCSRCRLYSWKIQLLATIVDRAESRREMHNARGPCRTKSLEDQLQRAGSIINYFSSIMFIISGLIDRMCVCHGKMIVRGRIRRRPHPPAEAGFLPLSRACGRTRAIEYESQVSTISQDTWDGYVVVQRSFFLFYHLC